MPRKSYYLYASCINTPSEKHTSKTNDLVTTQRSSRAKSNHRAKNGYHLPVMESVRAQMATPQDWSSLFDSFFFINKNTDVLPAAPSERRESSVFAG